MMRLFTFFTLLLPSVFFSCKEHRVPASYFVYIDTASSFTREFPKVSKPSYYSYALTNDKAQQLQLDTIDRGYNNFQARIWYEQSRGQKRKLVVIKDDASDWKGWVYELRVEWDGEKEHILTKTVKEVVPKSGWNHFMKRLIDLRVTTLPDMYAIEELVDNWKDGHSYSVEIASKNQYRYYTYHVPEEFQQYEETRDMSAIIDLLKEELAVERIDTYERLVH